MKLSARILGAGALAILLAVAGFREAAAFAQEVEPAAVTPCGNTIASCGCTITKPGFYEVTANLSKSQGLTALGDCLDVKAPKVVLNTDGHNLVGPGGMSPTGIGLHLLKSATGAFVEGNGSRFYGWDTGIQDDANNVIVEWFYADGNCGSSTCPGNGRYGVVVDHAKGSNINDLGAGFNGIYGVWLKAASNDQINCSNTQHNGVAGVFVGCSGNGPTGAKCPGVGPSKNNRIYDHSSRSNGHYGFVIDTGNTGMIMTDLGSSSNPTFDMFDGNANCDSNLWFDAGFTTANQTCIEH